MKHECPHCHHTLPDSANFCPRCGASTEGELLRSTTRLSPLMRLWRQLSPRMTRREALRLFGEPARIDLVHSVESAPSRGSPDHERWTLEYESTADPSRNVTGEILISMSEARVISWIEPDWKLMNVVKPKK